MELNALMEHCSTIKIHEERAKRDEYREFVIFTKDTAALEKILTDVLGVPAKPVGTRPSNSDAALAQPYGGVWIDQALWKKELSDGWIIAMLWPWQDFTHTTVKIARLKK